MDEDGSVRSAAACGLREWERDGACALAHRAPAAVPGGWFGSDPETCLGNGAVLVRWTPAAAVEQTNQQMPCCFAC